VPLLQANPRQAFWQWMVKYKKGYSNDLQVEKVLSLDAESIAAPMN
jgi:hypothetical protein